MWICDLFNIQVQHSFWVWCVDIKDSRSMIRSIDFNIMIRMFVWPNLFLQTDTRLYKLFSSSMKSVSKPKSTYTKFSYISPLEKHQLHMIHVICYRRSHTFIILVILHNTTFFKSTENLKSIGQEEKDLWN